MEKMLGIRKKGNLILLYNNNNNLNSKYLCNACQFFFKFFFEKVQITFNIK